MKHQNNLFSFYVKRKVLLLIFMFSASVSVCSAQTKNFFDVIYRNFDFFPRYSSDTYVGIFYLQKNAYFKKWYYVESDVRMKYDILVFRKKILYTWHYNILPSMGQTPNNVVFDPMDVEFGLQQTLQFPVTSFDVTIGLDHRCFHEIDKKEFFTTYWNKPSLSISSQNSDLYKYWQNLIIDSSWNLSNRFCWSYTLAYYATDFFGLVDKSKVNGGHYYNWETNAETRFALYKRRSWFAAVHVQAALLHWNKKNEDGYYWKSQLGIENNFRRGKRGYMIFTRYNMDRLPLIDGLPRYSKDGLLMVGLRLFF